MYDVETGTQWRSDRPIIRNRKTRKVDIMDIVQTFYNNMASQYDKLFADWEKTTKEQAEFLKGIFDSCGFDSSAKVLDCACGIGTQAVGLAALGYDVTGSDISEAELEEAEKRAAGRGVDITFKQADFCELEKTFDGQFDIVMAMDNALPHMLTADDLSRAVKSIAGQVRSGGIFVASIRDYDSMLLDKPPYSPPYIHETSESQRISFQTWKWEGDNYRLVQYIIEDGEALDVSKFECEYRATRRDELTKLLKENGCSEVRWLMPEESGFYQPVVVARK